MDDKGKLYLVPTPIGKHFDLPAFPVEILFSTAVFIVEDVASARRFLKKSGYPHSPDELVFLELNEHSREEDAGMFLPYIMEGKDVALMSEAGLPCVADPGATAVKLAHARGIEVVPLPGNSSIFLSLMASGANGQHFTFHGYLPREKHALVNKLRDMERRAAHYHESQLFMETPYRNEAMLEMILKACQPATMLCVACDLFGDRQSILSKPIHSWRSEARPDYRKAPAIFVLFT